MKESEIKESEITEPNSKEPDFKFTSVAVFTIVCAVKDVKY